MRNVELNEKAIFNVAREIDSSQVREEYLNQVCGEDSEMLRRVSTLLNAHEKDPAYLEPSSSDIAPTLDVAPTAVQEKPGMKIGRYKLVHEIGHGGMGVVYMAVQKEPVKRKVALKIIKPGMDTKEVVSRFEAERQALALMDHQCIATVLDGGSTESGRPYFVMELVEGTPIGEYCDACRYTTRQRLELFIQVCQAVQHAHLKGIIHRDIKPSNILVTTYDTVAVPKVIDFGIAKAVHQPLTDASVYTNIQQMVGTPLYMSPEQAQRTALDVDTRTDVYSLGVLLYEILTGTTPFDKERFKESGLDEVKRIIREEEPPKPSTRLSTLGETGIALDTIAEQHHTDLRTLTRELSGELDWIVMNALEKDRNRRYESASDFAKDVQRYLDDEPVEACPPSTAYRLGKFARRNRAALVTVSAVALALIVGASIATWQAFVATDAKNLAQNRLEEADTERQRAKANFDLAMLALDEVYLKAIGEEKLLHEEPESPEGEMMAPQDRVELSEFERDLLQRGLVFYDRFAEQNRDNPQAAFETGRAFYRVALLQSGLEENDEAQEAYTEAISRLKHLTEQHPSESKYFLELGKAYYGQGQLSRWWPSATDTFTEAKDALDRTIELDLQNAAAYRLRSAIHHKLTNYENEFADLRTAVRIAPNDAASHRELARSLLWSGSGRVGNRQDALLHAKMAVELQPTSIFNCNTLAHVYTSIGDFESAFVVFDRAAKLATSPASAVGVNFFADLARSEFYRSQGRYDEALAALDKAVELKPHSHHTYVRRGRIRRRLGNLEQALADFDKALELNPNYGWTYRDRGETYLVMQEYDKALADFSKSIQLVPESGHLYKRRADAYFRLGKFDEALADLNTTLDLSSDLSALWWISPALVATCPDESFHTGLLELADKAVQLRQETPRAYAARGWILAVFDHEERAMADLQTALDGITGTDESTKRLPLTCSVLGNLCGALAHREDVIPYLTKMAQLQPENPVYSYRAALAQLGADLHDSYRDTCRTILQQFGDSEKPQDAYWVAWTCLLGPKAIDDYTPVIRLAEQAVEADPDSDGYLKTLGGILYRAGRFEEAVQRLTEANKLIEDPDSKSTSSPAYTWYFLAMAHHKLGHETEAQEWLAKANEWTDKALHEHEEGTATLPWNRRLTLKLLRDETEQLIGTPDQPKDDTETEQEE